MLQHPHKHKHHEEQTGESHPTHETGPDARRELAKSLSQSHGGLESSHHHDDYLILDDWEIVIDEQTEAEEEEKAKKGSSEGSSFFLQERDKKLKDLARAFRADWRALEDHQLLIRKYTGGLSNKLYRCQSVSDRQKLLIRIYGTTAPQGSPIPLLHLPPPPKSLLSLPHFAFI